MRFQHAVTVALNHEQTKTNPQRIVNIELFINQYDWNEKNFP